MKKKRNYFTWRQTNIKTDDVYKDIAEDDEAIFDTINYELDRRLPKAFRLSSFGLMRDELGGNLMKKIFELRVKT